MLRSTVETGFGQAPDGTDCLPLRRPLPLRMTGREALVRDPHTAKVHFLNGAALCVWECCDGRTPVSGCESRLREKYAMPGDADVAGDIRRIVQEFSRQGLLDV